MPLRATGLALMVLVAVACASAPTLTQTAPTEPELFCNEPRIGGLPPPLRCQEVFDAASARLPALHGTVTEILIAWGNYCPGQFGCGGPRDTLAHAIFSFDRGDPFFVLVSEDPATGIVSVIEAGPLPTPQGQ